HTLIGDHPTHPHHLPTYPFQHKRYWQPSRAAATTDAASIGLGEFEHPLVGATVTRADSDELLLTGRLSLRTHPWLADHTVLGRVLLPGTAFVELALQAGAEVRAGHLEELTLEAPLVLAGNDASQFQVAVAAPDATGRRSVTVHSRPESTDFEHEWIRHADGVLAPEELPAGQRLTVWPPSGAEPVDLTGRYEDLAEQGFTYGPAFQGLRAVWRRGTEVFAELALPDEQLEHAGSFGLHPALLDSALHAIELGVLPGTGEARLPFAWSGVRLYASGATKARIRLAPAGTDAVTIEVSDPTGSPVLAVESLALRAISAKQLGAAAGRSHDALFRVEWVPAGAGGMTSATAAGTTLIRLAADATVHDAVHTALARTQQWLAEDRPEDERLVLVTSGAVGVGAEEDVRDLPGAAARGLLRSAQTENPDRIILLDLDLDDPDTLHTILPTALASGEPQIALRNGTLLTPRLTRITTPEP
ncbi:polyketide synthase dehydratase domain-containing protein, partial [Streptomyces sp. AP-93]|uniref:polyketide synthase dehydratase domain-containing protein n=1 Tax=Streptomyces sp. AP-93 TaxID=2929048 RepID=UPI001FAFA54A